MTEFCKQPLRKLENRVNNKPGVLKFSVSSELRLICLGLALSVLAVFGRLAFFDFVFFDDHVYVIEKAQVLAGLTAESIRWAFTATDAGFWHPLTWLSLMMDREIWGLNPGGYHITNVLLHLAATLLLFAALHRLTGALWKSGFVAALFALHPLHVESVAWIAERKDVLSGLFWMLSLLLYARYVERPGWGRYIAVLVSFFLGLMAKAMIVTIPIIFLLLDIWPCRRLWTGNWRKNWRPVVGEKIPFLLIGAVVGLVTIMAEQQVGALKTFEEFPFFARLTNAVVAYGFYLYKAALPFNLAVHYPHPGVWPLGTVVFAAAALALITFLAVKNLQTRPYLFVGWFWYLISLLPVSGLIQIGSHAYADRYTYIPLIGVFIAVVWGVGDWVAGKGRKREGVVTNGHLREGGDDAGDGENAVKAVIPTESRNGGGMPEDNGNEKGRPIVAAGNGVGDSSGSPFVIVAMRPLKNAFFCHSGLDPESRKLSKMLDSCFRRNDDGEIEMEFFKGIAIGVVVILVFALISYRQVGYWQNAETLFRRAVAVTENNWLAYNNLGAALSRQGRYGEAMPQFERALQIRPGYVEAIFNMGEALAGQGRYGEALPVYGRVLAMEPGFAAGHNNIAIAYARTGKIDQAIVHFREAIRIRPGYEDAIKNLSIAEKEKNRAAAK